MSRRAIPVRILLGLALTGFVAGPVLDACHHPGGHHGHGHVHAAVGAQSDQGRLAAHGPAGAETVSTAVDAGHAPNPIRHDGGLACFTAILLQPRPAFLLGANTPLYAVAILTRHSLLALGPTTPPP